MRILHIDDYYLPWLGYEADLAREQQAAGHDVWFAASNRVPAEKGGPPETVSDQDFPINAVRLRALTIGRRIIMLPGIVGVLLKVRPDAVHCHSVFDLTAAAVAFCKPVFRYRLVYCSHASSVNTDARSTWKRRAAYRLFRGVFGWAIRGAADHVVAVGENEKAMLVRELAVKPAKVGFLRLGAPLAQFKADEGVRHRQRARLDFREDDIVLLHAGTLAPRKRLLDLVEAVARLNGLREKIKLLIVGGGEPDYIAALEERARLHGMSEQVCVTGRFVDKDELRRHYAAADVGVWPGDYSVATLEAMAMELPIIVAANDPYTEFLSSRGNGLRFSPGDPDSLADCIASVVVDRQRRLEMGRASREFALAEFDWSSISKRSLQLYRGEPSGTDEGDALSEANQ